MSKTTVSCRRPAALLLALAALAGAGCAHVGEHVWVDAYAEPTQPKSAYFLSRGDVVFVRVWNQDGLSGRVRVRSDGMVSLPLVNDVEAAGFEPAAVAKKLQVKLKEFIVNPMVTVSLEDPAGLEISVMGEVARPGVYRVDQDPSVLKALASAGGLGPLASRDRIFVLRYGDKPGQPLVPVRIRFSYEKLAHAEGAAARFRLRSGDVVVVE